MRSPRTSTLKLTAVFACCIGQPGVSGWSVPSTKAAAPCKIQGRNLCKTLQSKVNNDDETPLDNQLRGRRQAMGLMSAAVLSGLLQNTEAASAFSRTEKTFPIELDTVGADSRTPRQKALEESAARPKKSALQSSPIGLASGAVLWGSSLWFLTGSRSNPLATPLANLLYNPEEEEWLQDRNDGLFAALPFPLLLVLGVVFTMLGFGVHLAAITLAEGSVAVSLQFAGVLLIGAGALEIGRIASGEKKRTRTDFDRDSMLEEEFEEFATQRLKRGGNVHRSEVVQAFRRFHAKYRQADSEDYPLNDLEIEQLLRQWNEQNAGAQRSAAGFYTGIQINADADIVIGR